MSAELPPVVCIGHADYYVREKKKADLLGETDNINTEFIIKKQQGPACKRDTVLHEVLHAIAFMSGYCNELEHATEERMVRALTPWILGVLRDNPKLVDYLLAGDDE